MGILCQFLSAIGLSVYILVTIAMSVVVFYVMDSAGFSTALKWGASLGAVFAFGAAYIFFPYRKKR